MKREPSFTNVLILSAIAGFILVPAAVNADRCLIAYPEAISEYHYDISEYSTVSFGDSLYDPMYDRGGAVLIDANTLEIAYDIYQAPDLAGFEPSIDGQEGYFTIGNEFQLIVDGFNNDPTTYENIILVFESDPTFCIPQIMIDGTPVTSFTVPVGDLAVSTPTVTGNNYSDILTFDIYWANCYGMRIWAYADENHNGMLDGGECFTAFSHDVVVPAQEETWGSIKVKFNE